MWLTFPWRPTKRIVAYALICAALTMVAAGLSSLLPEGGVREATRVFIVLVILLVAARIMARRQVSLGDSDDGRDGRDPS